MKRILSTFAALALVAATALPATAGMIDDIRSRGTVRIGVSLGGEPIGFRDAQNNPVGYDVDVATMLAEKLGVPVEFTDVSGDARVSMLVSGQLDIVVANTSATLERAKSVNFSIPYNRAGLRIIVQKDAGIASLEDLAGKKVVVGRGTTGEAFLKKAVPTAELVYTDNFSPDGVLLLQQKRVDAGIEDSSLLDYLATKDTSLLPTLVLLGGFLVPVVFVLWAYERHGRDLGVSAILGWLLLRDFIDVFEAQTWQVVGWQLLSSLLLTWLAMAFTQVTRSQAFGLVAIFLWPLLVESLINVFFQLVPVLRDHTGLLRFLPFSAQRRMVDVVGSAHDTFGDPLSHLGGAIVFGALTTVLMAVGLSLFVKRDA